MCFPLQTSYLFIFSVPFRQQTFRNVSNKCFNYIFWYIFSLFNIILKFLVHPINPANIYISLFPWNESHGRFAEFDFELEIAVTWIYLITKVIFLHQCGARRTTKQLLKNYRRLCCTLRGLCWGHPALHVLDVSLLWRAWFIFPSSGLLTFIRCFEAGKHDPGVTGGKYLAVLVMCNNVDPETCAADAALFQLPSVIIFLLFLTHCCEAPVILCFLGLKWVPFDKKNPGWMPQLCTSTPSPASHTPVKWILAVGNLQKQASFGCHRCQPASPASLWGARLCQLFLWSTVIGENLLLSGSFLQKSLKAHKESQILRRQHGLVAECFMYWLRFGLYGKHLLFPFLSCFMGYIHVFIYFPAFTWIFNSI